MTQRHRRTEVTDQRGKDSAECPSKAVGETLARAPQAGREEFGEKRTDRAEDARAEESQREPQRQHSVIANRPVSVRRDGGEGGRCKENERRFATEAVGKMGAG